MPVPINNDNKNIARGDQVQDNSVSSEKYRTKSSLFAKPVISCVLLIWGLFGGLLLHFFLANFRDILLTPTYLPPIDTAKDILDRGMIPFVQPGAINYIGFLRDSPNPTLQELANQLYVPKNWDEYDNLCKIAIQQDNTHVYLGKIHHNEDVYTYGKYYNSKDVLEGTNPYGGSIMNKKWPHLDDYQSHIMYYHQVPVVRCK